MCQATHTGMDGDGEAEVAQRQREIKFGRRLAANDKKTRDKALKKLKAWLRKQSELSDLDNCKLWRGLFYCMWMSDKPLVQEELGGELAGLFLNFDNPESFVRFAHAFFIVMGRDWTSIDRLRIDKFYMMVRKCLGHMFLALRKGEWDTKLTTGLSEVLGSVPFALNSKYPSGLKWFLVEKFVPELAAALQEQPHQESVALLLEPLLQLLAFEKDRVTREKVLENVFGPLLATDDASVDREALSQRCFQLAADPKVEPPNRSVLYGLRKAALKTEKAAAAVPDTAVADQDEAEEPEPVPEPELESVTIAKRPREASTPVIETPKKKKVKRVHGAVAPAPEEKTPPRAVTATESPSGAGTHIPQAGRNTLAATERKRSKSNTDLPPAPSSEPHKRRVQIVLAKNRVKEFNKFHRLARPDSPRVFDPAKRPGVGVLKKSPSEPTPPPSHARSARKHANTPLRSAKS